jgi:hypothetical protein
VTTEQRPPGRIRLVNEARYGCGRLGCSGRPVLCFETSESGVYYTIEVLDEPQRGKGADMTRNREIDLEDIGPAHVCAAEIPISDNGEILYWRCRCGARVTVEVLDQPSAGEEREP